MRDKVSESRAKLLHPHIRDRVIEAIDKIESGFPAWIAVRIVQGLRTIVEQNSLYALGRTVRNPDGYDKVKLPMGNIVTKAKGGSSMHNYGLAVDFCVLYDKDRNGIFEEISWSMVRDGDLDGVPDWTEIVIVFMEMGFAWGGKWRTFVDNPHVEDSAGNTWRQLLAKYNKKDFIENANFVNL